MDNNNLKIAAQRQLDELGRIVIPKAIRKKLNLEKNQLVNVVLVGDKIEITRSTDMCIFCDSLVDIKQYNGYYMCRKCIEDLVEKLSER